MPGLDNIFLQKGSEFFCPVCRKGTLIFRDYCCRIVRYEGGTHEWIWIPRHQCDNSQCNRIHRMLPDILVPYKHYTEETVAGVLDEVISADDADSENYPAETTMIRWHHWFMANQLNIEGHIKSIGYRLLGFGGELLRSGSSLLSHMRSSIPDSWLKVILRYIYNSGNSLQAYYT